MYRVQFSYINVDGVTKGFISGYNTAAKAKSVVKVTNALSSVTFTKAKYLGNKNGR